MPSGLDAEIRGTRPRSWVPSVDCVILVFIIVELIIRGTEFTLVLISTAAMVAPLLADNPVAFRQFLNDLGSRSVWRGPYPETNYSAVTTVPLEGDTDETLNTTSTITFDGCGRALAAATDMQVKINLHLWGANLLMKCWIFAFGWILLFSAKKKWSSGTLAWFAYSIPLLIHCLLELVLDLSLGDFLGRRLQSQVSQCSDILWRTWMILLVAILHRRIVTRNSKILNIGRYDSVNNVRSLFKRDREDNVLEMID